MIQFAWEFWGKNGKTNKQIVQKFRQPINLIHFVERRFHEINQYFIESIWSLKILEYEKQNEEYEGVLIETIGGEIIRSRFGKRTPKKSGYFVAFWEKNPSNKNRPFQAEASPKELAIVVIDTDYEGIFIIPRDTAIRYRILTNETQLGKMAMRFYPPWCQALNETAKATQKWQLK